MISATFRNLPSISYHSWLVFPHVSIGKSIHRLIQGQWVGPFSSHLGKAQTSAKHAKPSTFLHSMTATGIATVIGPTGSTSGKIEDWQANLREEQTVEPVLCNNPPKEKHVFLYVFCLPFHKIYCIYIYTLCKYNMYYLIYIDLLNMMP